MNGGLQFSVAGIPVRVLPFFFIASVLLGAGYRDLTLVAAWVAIVFVGVLLHELGHAVAYRAFGVQPQIVLHGFGGLTFGRSLPVGKDLVVSLAGPLVGIVIGLPLLIYANTTVITDVTVWRIVNMAIFVNLGWAVLNLLPILPLDGGNAMNALLSLLFRRDMTLPTRVLSIVTAAALIVVALFLNYLFGVLLLGWFIYMNAQGIGQARRDRSRFAPVPPSAPPSAPAPPTADAPPVWGPLPDAPPTAPEPAPAADGPRPAMPKGRTFGDEMASATRSLATGQPELAALAVDRARRLAIDADQHAAVDRLDAHVAARLAGP